MKRKLLVMMLTVMMTVACAIGFTACEGSEQPSGQGGEDTVWTVATVYARAQELGYAGTLEEFIAQISGKDGADGVGISDISVNEEGDLIVKLTDGREVNCGRVLGEKGDDGVSITAAWVDENGDLFVDLSTGETLHCGNVRGMDGRGIARLFVDEEGNLAVIYTDGTDEILGNIIGQDGVGVKSIVIDENGRMIVTLTNETELDLGVVVGKDGQDGADGTDGKDGDSVSGARITDAGELELTFDSGKVITVGNVVGQNGQDGADGKDGVGVKSIVIDENGRMIVTLTNETELDLGVVVGKDGQDGTDGTDGKDGDSVSGARITDAGELELTFDSGKVITVGNVVGQNGQDGQDGADGKDGVGVKSIVIDENGRMIVTLTNETELDLGVVVGKDGEDGADGTDGKDGDSVSGARITDAGELELTFDSGKVITVGNVVGQNGQDGQDCADGQDGVGVKSIVIDENGRMIVTLTNETELDLGVVVGKDGQDGASVTKAEINAEGHLILTFSDEHTLDCGNVKGTDGVGISSIYFNAAGELIIRLSDNSEVNCGKIPVCTHSYSDWAPQMDATCTSIGYETRTCAICGNTEYQFTEALGHTASDCTYNQSVHSYYCGRCGLFVQEKHTFDNNVCIVCNYEVDYSLGLQYSLNEDRASYSVIGIGSCTDTNLVIPSLYNNLPVTGIGAYAFNGCNNLTGITIPESVTALGNYAFRYCTGLTEIYYNAAEVADLTSSSHVFGNAGTAGNGITVIFGDTVTSIPAYLFYDGSSSYYHNITNIIIGNRVTSIGSYAFSWSTELTSVIIGNNVTSIGDYAFSQCTELTNITIPNSVTSIGNRAFYGCGGLTNVTIGNNVTSIGNYAFYNCSGLTEIYYNAAEVADLTSSSSVFSNAGTAGNGITVIFGDTVKSLPAYLFYDSNLSIHPNIISVTIGKNVTRIGASVFGGCEDLTEIYYYATEVTECGSFAFSRAGSESNNGLTVFIDNSVKTIPDYLFSSTRIISITIPDSVTSIGNSAFYLCYWLTELTIGKNVTSIGTQAFVNCNKLVDVYNQSSLQLVPGSQDYGWVTYYAKNVYTQEGETWLTDTADGYRFLYAGSTGYLLGYYGTATDLILPDSFTSYDGTEVSEYEIYDNAFYECRQLTSISVSDSVTRIGSYAFKSCTGLTNLSVGANVANLGWMAFNNCNALLQIEVKSNNVFYHSENNCLIQTESKALILGCNNSTIPSSGSVTSIEDYAFFGCTGLTSITIPDSVTSIGADVFMGCRNLTSIIIPDSVTSIGGRTFMDTGYYNDSSNWENGVLYIGKHLICADSTLSGAYEIKEGTLTIASWAFLSKHSLTSITIPDSVTNIGYESFDNCLALTSISIGTGVTSIGDRAFNGCPDLTDVYYNAKEVTGLTFSSKIFNRSGRSSEGIKFIFGDAVETVPAYILYGNSTSENPNIISVTIGNNVTIIGEWAFYGCRGLTSITLPESVTTIGNYAFEYCTLLTNVTIGNNVTSIGNLAFYGCSSLTNVYYTGTAEEWAAISNTSLTSATVYYYSEELTEEQKADSNNYWHYVDGVPVVWTKETT